MCVYIYIYTTKREHRLVGRQAVRRACLCTYVCMCACLYIYVCVSVYFGMSVCTQPSVNIDRWEGKQSAMPVCLLVCMYACSYVYTYTYWYVSSLKRVREHRLVGRQADHHAYSCARVERIYVYMFIHVFVCLYVIRSFPCLCSQKQTKTDTNLPVQYSNYPEILPRFALEHAKLRIWTQIWSQTCKIAYLNTNFLSNMQNCVFEHKFPLEHAKLRIWTQICARTCKIAYSNMNGAHRLADIGTRAHKNKLKLTFVVHGQPSVSAQICSRADPDPQIACPSKISLPALTLWTQSCIHVVYYVCVCIYIYMHTYIHPHNLDWVLYLYAYILYIYIYAQSWLSPLYVCIYTYMHIYTYIHIYIYIFTISSQSYIYIYIYTYIYIFRVYPHEGSHEYILQKYIHAHICMYVYMYNPRLSSWRQSWLYLSEKKYMYIYIYVCVCMYACMYV